MFVKSLIIIPRTYVNVTKINGYSNFTIKPLSSFFPTNIPYIPIKTPSLLPFVPLSDNYVEKDTVYRAVIPTKGSTYTTTYAFRFYK